MLAQQQQQLSLGLSLLLLRLWPLLLSLPAVLLAADLLL
jgi:hypothetical protein